MAKSIDFGVLLRDLFQDEQEHPKTQRYAKPKATIPQALGAMSQTEKHCGGTQQVSTPPLQACNLYDFMRKIVIEHFGMGRDYAFCDRDGTPLKSWFTIPEAIEMAERNGYKLTIAEARAYLETLIKQRYIETDNYKYRRRAFWDKQMEQYLRNTL